MMNREEEMYQKYLEKEEQYLKKYKSMKERFGVEEQLSVEELEKLSERYRKLLAYLDVSVSETVFPAIEELDVLADACVGMNEQFVFQKYRIRNKLFNVLNPFWKKGDITVHQVPLCIKYLKEFILYMQQEGITNGAEAADKMMDFMREVNEWKILHHDYLWLKRRCANYMKNNGKDCKNM